MKPILVVGSVGYDTISTPLGRRKNILGGSANYFSVAASMYAPVRVVGVVGEDYRREDRQLLEARNVDMTGLQQVPGKTFAWEGTYENDMNEAITLSTHLNVFENFQPKIPESYRTTPVVFLANIDPVLQLQVLEQVKSPQLVAADTMNYWIKSKKSDFMKVLSRIHVLLINETELRLLTGDWNTLRAARAVAAMGPKAVVIKRGEYGFAMFNRDRFFILPAFPVENVTDPTGAGDTFAGGFLGHLAQVQDPFDREALKHACVHGCLMASFSVQDFGLEGMLKIDNSHLQERLQAYSQVIAYVNTPAH